MAAVRAASGPPTFLTPSFRNCNAAERLETATVRSITPPSSASRPIRSTTSRSLLALRKKKCADHPSRTYNEERTILTTTVATSAEINSVERALEGELQTIIAANRADMKTHPPESRHGHPGRIPDGSPGMNAYTKIKPITRREPTR